MHTNWIDSFFFLSLSFFFSWCHFELIAWHKMQATTSEFKRKSNTIHYVSQICIKFDAHTHTHILRAAWGKDEKNWFQLRVLFASIHYFFRFICSLAHSFVHSGWIRSFYFIRFQMKYQRRTYDWCLMELQSMVRIITTTLTCTVLDIRVCCVLYARDFKCFLAIIENSFPQWILSRIDGEWQWNKLCVTNTNRQLTTTPFSLHNVDFNKALRSFTVCDSIICFSFFFGWFVGSICLSLGLNLTIGCVHRALQVLISVHPSVLLCVLCNMHTMAIFGPKLLLTIQFAFAMNVSQCVG